jgi:hypothetical protein
MTNRRFFGLVVRAQQHRVQAFFEQLGRRVAYRELPMGQGGRLLPTPTLEQYDRVRAPRRLRC